MKRRHLFEIEDQPWFPRTVRGYFTDCLQWLFTTFLDQAPVVARLAEWLDRTGSEHVLDLCSGSSGPWLGIAERLSERDGPAPRVTLSDLYPHPEAFERLRRGRLTDRIAYWPEPVDARDPDAASIPGVDARTVFAGLHHFPPRDARALLADAARRGVPFAAFEISERSLSTLAVMPFMGLAVWIMTPFLRPVSPLRLLLTYLVPIVPFGVTWDGFVSCLRSYTVEELRRLTDEATVPGYRWQVGQDRLRLLPIRVTWIFGEPIL